MSEAVEAPASATGKQVGVDPNEIPLDRIDVSD